MEPNDLIGSAEALRILGRSRSTVQRLVTAGQLVPVMRAPGTNHGTFLFRREDVERLAGHIPAQAAS